MGLALLLQSNFSPSYLRALSSILLRIANVGYCPPMTPCWTPLVSEEESQQQKHMWAIDTCPSTCPCLSHKSCFGHPDWQPNGHNQILGRIPTRHATLFRSTESAHNGRWMINGTRGSPGTTGGRNRVAGAKQRLSRMGAWEGGLRAKLVVYHSLSLPSLRPGWRTQLVWDLPKLSLLSS